MPTCSTNPGRASRVRRAIVVAALACLFSAAPAAGNVSLELEPTRGIPPELFSNNMVLQRDTNVPIWGSATPGENVSVAIAGQTKTTVTPSDGRWRVELDPLAAGGPHEMTITGNNTIVLTGILVGDVWICAGQSNMVVRRPGKTFLLDYPDIRAISRGGTWSDRPSGMAFAFAREIQFAVGVPVGIINRAAGGTAIRNWLAPSASQDPDPAVQAIMSNWGEYFGEEYDRHVAPFKGFPVRGVVYWQGEQDLKLSRQIPKTVENFAHLLPALIRSWRQDWQQGDIPFVLVQLPTGGGLQPGQIATPLPLTPPDPTIAVLMRQSTFNGLTEPATALTVSIDIEGGVHPGDRELYGYRMANAALAVAYGQSFVYSGPIYASMSIEDSNRVRLRFKPNTAEGLTAEGGALAGFAISADGENFVWAQAEIQANEVVVWNDSIVTPAVVRYGWDRHPTWANLFNGAGLGTAPFSITATPAP